MSDPRLIEPLRGPFDVALRVPGSKSLTNRFYVLAALAAGSCRIRRPLRADDTDRLLAALATLGVEHREDGEDVLINGCGGRLPGGGHVDLGDGGTPTRFLLALATLAAGEVVIDGSPRMRERPVDEGLALLRELGAKIEGTRREGVERLPVRVQPGAALRGGVAQIGQTQSSQFLSALMLIGPTMAKELVLRYRTPPTSASYLDLTLWALRRVGVKAVAEKDRDGALAAHRVTPQSIEPFDVTVESDASSSAYFAVAAAVTPRARVRLEGISRYSPQPDLRLLDALQSMGAIVERGDDSVTVEGGTSLRGMDVDASLFPDASLALAAACACAGSSSKLRGLATLAVKESDRITALATELSRIGCRCVATPDSLLIDPARRHGAAVVIETYRDHRMAMSFAVLGLARPGISIADPACVGKSYPTFWEDFERLRGAVVS